MFDDRSFRRVAAWAAIASAPLAVAGSVLALASVDFDLGAFADPGVLLGAGARGAALWRWAMVLDLFGRFLLVAPMFAVLARHWRVRGDAGRALGATANAYVFAGAVGAVVLAATLPPIMTAYASEPAQRATLAPLFDVLANAVYVGLWNMLGATLGGIAWLGVGAVLRTDRPGLAGLSTTLGAAALVDALATMAGIHVAAMAGLSLYLVLAPVWALSAGVDALELHRRETAALPTLVPRAG